MERLGGKMCTLRHLERQLARGDVISPRADADQPVARAQDGGDRLGAGLVVGDLQQGADGRSRRALPPASAAPTISGER